MLWFLHSPGRSRRRYTLCDPAPFLPELTWWNDVGKCGTYESLGLSCRNSLGWNEYECEAVFHADIGLQKPY